MNTISSMNFPVLAFTPNGVMPYSAYPNMLRVMKHEYDMGWYENLEVIDISGTCAVVRYAVIEKEPTFAKLLGRMVKVEIQKADILTEYDVESTRSRVLEFLSLFPDLYQAAGCYEQLVSKVKRATTPAKIVGCFFE